MIPHHKRRAIIGVTIGLALIAASLFLSFRELIPLWLRLVLFSGGIGLYVLGCLSLAKAKGYSSAIVLTVVLGILFPVVVLLALPDKNKLFRRS